MSGKIKKFRTKVYANISWLFSRSTTVFENWLKAEKFWTIFQKFKELISIKDCTLALIPAKVALFLKDQRAEDLKDLEVKGTSYFDTYVFLKCARP